ncbi:MAG TPA: LysR substrate-binding domain-containing protein [Gemmatimonadaceae bacterium]|nr:LysR substrate-binding domain-containing protein [Gemmatimonadaceae bacterium]
MILRHLRYFVAVADEGSVAGAARTLRIAQPALSRHIQNLENDVGFRVLERKPRGVEVTPAGDVLLAGARTLLRAVMASVARARRSHEGQLGRVRIGVGRSPIHDPRIGAALATMRADYPDVHYVVLEALSINQDAALLGGEIDVGIGLGLADRELVEEGVRAEPLYDEPVNMALVAKNHPLASRAELRPDDLRGETLITTDAAMSPLFGPASREMERHGLLANAELHERLDTLWNIVAAGRGWTLGPATYLKQPPAGTVAIPIRGFNAQLQVMVRWRESDTSRLTRNIVDVFRRVAGVPSAAPRARRATPAAGTRALSHARTPADAAPHVEMRFIQALLAAVEEGSLSEAASRLHVTQSAVSRQIRALEDAFGVPLLIRDANGVTPTTAGAIVADDVHRALAEFEHVLAQARRVDRGFSGVCLIGSIAPEMSHRVLFGAIDTMARESPSIAVEIQEMMTPRQLPALRSGQIDIGIALSHADARYDRAIASMQLVQDAMECALLPATHPLASRAWVRPTELADLPFLFIGRHVFPTFYDTVMDTFEQIGLRPQADESYTGPRALWRLVRDGHGWALGPQSLRAHPIPGIVAVPIEGLSIPSGLDLLWRRDETNPSVLAVLEVFRGTQRKAS